MLDAYILPELASQTGAAYTTSDDDTASSSFAKEAVEMV
jgi:hypothetical protein